VNVKKRTFQTLNYIIRIAIGSLKVSIIVKLVMVSVLNQEGSILG